MLKDRLRPQDMPAAREHVVALHVHFLGVFLHVDHAQVFAAAQVCKAAAGGCVLVVPLGDEGVVLLREGTELGVRRVVDRFIERFGLDRGHERHALVLEGVLELSLAQAWERRDDAGDGAAGLIGEQFARARAVVAEAQDVHAVHEPGFEFVLAALVHAACFELEQLGVQRSAVEKNLVRLGRGRLHWRADLFSAGLARRTLRVHAFALGEPQRVLRRLGPIHLTVRRCLPRGQPRHTFSPRRAARLRAASLVKGLIGPTRVQINHVFSE